ncbi:MAG: VWA domain-containing protein [Actinomycetota bacterium]
MTTGDGLLGAIERLVDGLRGRGVDIGVSEVVDATTAAREIDVLRREELRAALRCTIIRHHHHLPVFDEVFDRHFPARPTRAMGRPTGDDGPGNAAPTGGDDRAPLDEAAETVVEAGDDRDLRLLAERAVEEHGGFEDGARTERYHVYRVLRALDLAKLLTEVTARARADGEELDRRELEARIEALRRMISEQVRAELAHHERDLDDRRTADPFDVELARATATELDEMRRAVRPLARQLAARLRRRRQSLRSGRVDMRRTMRRSLTSGGVPLDVAHRRPRAHKPDVFVLCDISGSVADVAGFTLTFLSALSDELARTRAFAFVDAIDEITELVQESADVVEPWRLLQHGRVIGDDGHSDYGAVLQSFWEQYGRTGLTDRSTVIVTGDARNNYRPDRAEVLGEIAARARALYWLNPEPEAEWDTTDSIVATYRRDCSDVFEVRTLRQLESAISAIL